MNVIPVPELVAVLGITLVLLVARAVYRAVRSPRGAHAADLRRSRQMGADPERMRARLIASCVMFAIMSIPLVLRLVPPNGIYGFRTSATHSSPAVWYSANAFMGWALLIAAIVSATLLAVLPGTVRRWLLWATFLVPMFERRQCSFLIQNSRHVSIAEYTTDCATPGIG